LVKPRSNACGWSCATPTFTVAPDPAPGLPVTSLLDAFAEQLSDHTDQADIQAGRGTALDSGGHIAKAAAAIRVPEGTGQALFETICKRLGEQAR
jgi:hypothetical protein